MPDRVYEFDSYRIETASRRLLRDDEPLALSSRAFDVLLALLERHGEIVSQEDLINHVWQDQAVEPNNLSQAIKQIRRALGDSGREQRYLITVPRQGFKFIMPAANGDFDQKTEEDEEFPAPVDLNLSSAEDAAPTFAEENKNLSTDKENFTPVGARPTKRLNRFGWKTAAAGLVIVGAIAGVYFWQTNRTASALGVKTIAVLPFQNLGTATEADDALRIGMTDALITRLSRINEISVTPTGLVSRFNKPDLDPLGAGRELNVDAVLDGHVQKDGEKVRVSLQMIRTADGKTLWSDVFTDEFDNIFQIQDSISLKIAETLSLELSDEERRALMKSYTSSAQAYRLYLDAINSWRNLSAGEARLQAEKNLIEAIRLDPKFALAYLGLARVALQSPSRENYEKMRELARQAIEIDGELGDAYAAYAFALWRGDWNWTEAERNFKKAVSLKNSNPLAYQWYMMFLAGEGRFEESLAILNSSPFRQKDEPPYGNFTIYYFSRNYEKAVETGNYWLEKRPNALETIAITGRAYTELGMHEKAIEYMEKAAALNELQKQTALNQLGYAYARAGQTEKAREILKRTEKMFGENPETIDYGGFVILYGALGDRDKAFEYLEKSIEQRESWAYMLKVSPQFDSLRGDSRFAEMLRKVNLTP